MRQVKEFDTADGKRYRVRFRMGERQTSETFRRRQDAVSFATVLDGGGVSEAMAWLNARDNKEASWTFAAWFDHYVTQLTGVTERTRGDYRSLRSRYFAHLDPLLLSQLTRGHITTIVNDMQAKGRAPKTIKQAIHTLSTCLQLAVDEGHMAANPCRRVRLPSNALAGAEPRFLTYEEFAALVGATPEHYRPLVVWLFGTGMRWSEATALQSRHVNIKAGTARVEQAWKRVPGGFEIGPPKSAKSKRTVNAAVMALKAAKPLLGPPNGLVFRMPNGNPIRHANFHKHIWKPSCARAGLDPAPRIHDARHSHASWLISDGIQLEAVQDQLGHESILTTRKVYGHLLPALGVAVGKSASAALDAALPNGLESLPALQASADPDE